MRAVLRLLATLVVWGAVGACAGALAVLLAPLGHGGRPLVVLSDSMAPALSTGDAVLVDRIRPHQARLGDIVTFRPPRGGDQLISHRVVGVRREPDSVAFITRGDANSEPERWSVARDASIGRVERVLPMLGRVAIATDNPLLRGALAIAAALVIAVLLLARIWGTPAAPPRAGTRAGVTREPRPARAR